MSLDENIASRLATVRDWLAHRKKAVYGAVVFVAGALAWTFGPDTPLIPILWGIAEVFAIHRPKNIERQGHTGFHEQQD